MNRNPPIVRAGNTAVPSEINDAGRMVCIVAVKQTVAETSLIQALNMNNGALTDYC